MKTFVIQHDNIVLDGAHHLIEGNKSWTGLAPYFGDAGNNGIIITGRNNINITNLNIEVYYWDPNLQLFIHQHIWK